MGPQAFLLPDSATVTSHVSPHVTGQARPRWGFSCCCQLDLQPEPGDCPPPPPWGLLTEGISPGGPAPPAPPGRTWGPPEGPRAPEPWDGRGLGPPALAGERARRLSRRRLSRTCSVHVCDLSPGRGVGLRSGAGPDLGRRLLCRRPSCGPIRGAILAGAPQERAFTACGQVRAPRGRWRGGATPCLGFLTGKAGSQIRLLLWLA